jgi:hypothetical protein
MRSKVLVLFCLAWVGLQAGPAAGQIFIEPAASGPAVSPGEDAGAPAGGGQDGLPPEEVEKLVAPIALFPDVLVAQMIPGSR